jgi:uncharacterized protein (DUF1499 family)
MRDRMLPVASMLAIAGVLLPLAGALGTRWGLWRFVAGFSLLAIGVLAALAAIVLGIIGGSTSGRWGLAGAVIVGGLVVVAVPVSVVVGARGAPAIHDISTDTENPPQFREVLPLRGADASPAAYDGASAADQQRRAYPDVHPILVAAPPQQAMIRAIDAARALGWTIIGQDPGRGTLEATDTTFWFGFTDDIVVRVSAAGTGSRVDIRSKSRVGIGDLGANARRIRRFTAEMRR